MKLPTNSSLKKYYGNNHAAKVIYGIILMFGALVGLAASGPSSELATALKAFIAALTIIVAEDYAEIIGFTIKHKRALSKQERSDIFADTFAIATFTLTPSVILLASATGLYTLTTAFNLAFGYCLLVLFMFSYWAGRLSNYSKQKALLIAILTAGLGMIIILMKYEFSH